jgi:DNA helicase-2/ATP-dependent DNA helicase PcrA
VSIWGEIRRQARNKHLELAKATSSLVPASELLAAAELTTGVRVSARPADDVLLDGAEAVYRPEQKHIYFSSSTPPAVAAFHVAHEFAHHWIDDLVSHCLDNDLDVFTPAEPEMSLVGEPDTYSPKERIEAQANLFAREFLLPRAKLAARWVESRRGASEIAEELGLPRSLVMQQLADALLLPEEGLESSEPEKPPGPDESQAAAMGATSGPIRICAGPGTGKSTTLVGRAKHLVERGENERSIVVLTFSNFSAQDLAYRLQLALGGRATGIWIGTFHAFGLELLRKYSVEAGFAGTPRLLDRTGSLMVLEDLLPQLQLSHYLDLVDPIRGLRPILKLISRAKDELVSPEQYRQLAMAMIESGDETEKNQGEKALEVARAYGIYEAALRDRGCVDFGDLICRPVELFVAHPEVRDVVREKFRHVLVDEYQDMNRASGVLLNHLVSPGTGPWVVGDVRQSIYRFRGASPANMARFADDFPGATTKYLAVNYRSAGRLIRTFEAFGREMPVGDSSATIKLEAARGERIGEVTLDVATTPEAESEGIAQAILRSVGSGGRFRDHAVLARSHRTLARLSSHLERRGVPCLYFGDYFERSEVRDLLSMLSVVSERRGLGLYRVAQFPQCGVPLADVHALFRCRREQNTSMLKALGRLQDVPNLSDEGRIRLGELAADVGPVAYKMGPHEFLLEVLFGRGRQNRVLDGDPSVAAQQRRLAVYQLLQLAFTFRSRTAEDPKRAFLEHIRRLEILDEEKELRHLPAAASQIDAVRLMTVHASKGLEFPQVHLPSLTARHFPVNRADLDPPPRGLVPNDPLMSRSAEEESLFFVALSRAKDALHLSRAVSYGGGAWADVKPSPYLWRIADHLPRPPDAAPNWIAAAPHDEHETPLPAPARRESWPARAIETYLECPRRFYYDEVVDLGGSERSTPYLQFQSALHNTLAWLRDAPLTEDRKARVSAQLASDWEQFGPRGHAFESIYRVAAEQMLGTALSLMRGSNLPVELSIKSGEVVVTSRADQISVEPDGIVIRRFKAAKLAKGEKAKLRHALMQVAVQKQYAGRNVHFEHVSLVSGERRREQFPGNALANEIVKIKSSFQKIESGQFEPEPDDFRCPRCPYFFICPAR